MEAVIRYASQHTFGGHPSLNADDIAWISNMLVDLDRSQLAMILVYSDPRGIGKWVRTWNEEVNAAIRARDTEYAHTLVTGPKEMFVELYDNDLLTSADRDWLLRLLARSLYAMHLWIDTLRDTPGSQSIASLKAMCHQEGSRCHASLLYDDPIRAVLSRYDTTPDHVYTVDMGGTGPTMFCFRTEDLFMCMSEPTPINPETGAPFSPYTLHLLQTRFRKELAMYRRYMRTRGDPQSRDHPR